MPDPEEQWRAVPGWPAYEVSNRGQARSVPRVLADGRRHGGTLLQQRTDPKGYRKVTLTEPGRRRTVRVHVIEMLAFAGAPPPDKPQVRHLNDDPADNRWPENLIYGDQADQEADKARKGLGGRRPGMNGQKNKTGHRRNKRATGYRALAIVASPVSLVPAGTSLPAETPVSSQVATGRETGPATALQQAGDGRG